MSYDFTGSWSGRAGHHAQLFPGNHREPSASAAVDYAISTGFPPRKILLGIPVYGRSFLGATGPGHRYNGSGGEDGTFEYKELPRNGTEEIINTRVVAAFCVGGDGGFVSYDNPETVKLKAKYCREKNLGVRFFFSGGGLGLCTTAKADFVGFVLLDWHRRCPTRSSKSHTSRIQGTSLLNI